MVRYQNNDNLLSIVRRVPQLLASVDKPAFYSPPPGLEAISYAMG